MKSWKIYLNNYHIGTCLYSCCERATDVYRYLVEQEGYSPLIVVKEEVTASLAPNMSPSWIPSLTGPGVAAQDRVEQNFFLNDVKYHHMTVLQSSEYYGHLRFERYLNFQHPVEGTKSFDIFLSPDCILVTGAMGTYAFSGGLVLKDANMLLIPNFNKWGARCTAIDNKDRVIREFCADYFKEVILKEYLRKWITFAKFHDLLPKGERKALWHAVVSDLVNKADSEGAAIIERVKNFKFVPRFGLTYTFSGIENYDFYKYTHNFKWCCRALVWGVSRYVTETQNLR